MRTLEEIKQDLEEIRKQREEIRARERVLLNEKAEVGFAKFLEKHNLQAGDIVQTERYGTFQVIGMSTSFPEWIICRKVKNDGGLYKVTSTHSESIFKNGKKIGHKPIGK